MGRSILEDDHTAFLNKVKINNAEKNVFDKAFSEKLKAFLRLLSATIREIVDDHNYLAVKRASMK